MKKKLKKLKNSNFNIYYIGLFFLLFSSIVYADDFWLVTNVEYDQIKSTDIVYGENLSSTIANGPVIKVIEPKITNQVSSPINIRLVFLPSANGFKPNMNSLVVHMKGLFTLDITKRVEKFIAGNELNIQDANIPKGQHKILIMIIDEAFQYSEKLISFKVL